MNHYVISYTYTYKTDLKLSAEQDGKGCAYIKAFNIEDAIQSAIAKLREDKNESAKIDSITYVFSEPIM